MAENGKRLPWRCKTIRQAKDKAMIYNSKEWRELRIRKLRANPLCERCLEGDKIKSATCVHHIHPIEDSTSVEDMRRLAFDWNNLQSLCRECHHDIHRESGSFSRDTIKQRQADRYERWADRLKNKFIK